MKKLIVVLIATSLLAPLLADTSPPPWKHYRSRNGVEIFKRTFPGSGIIEVRGIADVDAPAEVIDMLFRDVPAFTQYMHNCMISRAVH